VGGQLGAYLLCCRRAQLLRCGTRAWLRAEASPAPSAGLQGARWPNFTWVDQNQAVYKGNYQHWGSLPPGGGSSTFVGGSQALLEPNNRVPPEDCAGSNITDAALVDGVGTWADQRCFLPFVSVCEFEPLRMYPSTISSSGHNFTFYGAAVGQAAAEEACYQQGGHLAAYSSYQQQREVEQHFIGRVGPRAAAAQHLRRPGRHAAPRNLPLLCPQGYLKPLNQSAYWLGLQASDASWPAFRPLDPTAAPAGVASGSYQLWGLSAPSGKAEPKSRLELCAAANATITGYPNEDPWSWSGAACSRQLPFMCRQQPPGQWSFKAPSSVGALAAGAGAAAGAGGTNTYVLNTTRVPFDVAQAWCNDMGELQLQLQPWRGEVSGRRACPRKPCAARWGSGD
jgi:hypothetical protein